MGQMVLAGWARESVPARLYKRRLQCCASWNRPARHRINCRGLNIEGAVRAYTSYLSVLIGPLPAPVFLPKAARNHLSGTVHSIFPRDASFSLPRLGLVLVAFPSVPRTATPASLWPSTLRRADGRVPRVSPQDFWRSHGCLLRTQRPDGRASGAGARMPRLPTTPSMVYPGMI